MCGVLHRSEFSGHHRLADLTFEDVISDFSYIFGYCERHFCVSVLLHFVSLEFDGIVLCLSVRKHDTEFTGCVAEIVISSHSEQYSVLRECYDSILGKRSVEEVARRTEHLRDVRSDGYISERAVAESGLLCRDIHFFLICGIHIYGSVRVEIRRVGVF